MRPNKKLPRGLRLCNPCNIRISTDKFLGEVQPSSDKALKEFERNAYGYRAAFRVLLTYITRYHVNTMRGMIARFAPATENHTEAYVNTVAQRAAIDPDKELRTVDKEDLIRMVAAMSYVENGVEADMHEVVDGWILVNECPS
nr:MAG TPA: virion protein [Caudoviricetes sp.]DAP75976.1 MAG TPA: virion protein [Caudoviricetes sp.]